MINEFLIGEMVPKNIDALQIGKFYVDTVIEKYAVLVRFKAVIFECLVFDVIYFNPDYTYTFFGFNAEMAKEIEIPIYYFTHRGSGMDLFEYKIIEKEFESIKLLKT